MPDATTTETTETTTETATETATVDAKELMAEVDKWKAQSRKHEERAKANSKAADELEQLRKQSMNEQERAVAEAKALGRAEALAEVSGQLVDAAVKVAAAGRLEDDALDTLLDGLDRAKFLDESGQVDKAKVGAFVERIAPKPSEDTGTALFPDLGQGARGNAAGNGDPLLRDLKNLAGMR